MTRSTRILLTAVWLFPALLGAMPPPADASYLRFVEVKRDNQGGVDGVEGVEGVAVSPDGKHVYTTADDESALSVFRRDAATGRLTFIQVKRDGVGGVDGLRDAQTVSLSPDGLSVYAAGRIDNAIAVFRRDPMSGSLTFVEVVRIVNGLAGVKHVIVSPDGLHAYAAGHDDASVVSFLRDPDTGALTFIQALTEDVGGVDGLAEVRAIAISPDGATVYTASKLDDAVAVFARDADTGLLTFLQVMKDGIAGVDGLAKTRSVYVSPDGANVYATGADDDALAVFQRDPDTGLLTFLDVMLDGVNGVDGINGAQWVTVSPDGTHVLATGEVDDAVAVFARDPDTGLLAFVEVQQDGVNGVEGMNGPQPVTFSPEGSTVYVGGHDENAIAVFRLSCGDGVVDIDEECDDGNALNGDCCSSTCRAEPAGSSCAGDGNECTDDLCNAAGACTHPANTAPCDDGAFCTANDTCHGGSCNPGTPRDCSGGAGSCQQGTCDESNDRCVLLPKANGSACNDGSACTQSDSCQGGVCTGASPVVCAAPNACQLAGSCNPSTGVCSYPSKANGTACSDGNACTQSDSCQAGVCAGSNPIVCAAVDQCHGAGTCNPSTGTCSSPNKPNGTTCDDGNACTATDACQAGTCAGVARPNGSACTDGNACTQSDTCQGGVCAGGNPVVCAAPDQCHTGGTCNPATGVCSNPSKPNGTTCDDGNTCTDGDACQAGACTGAVRPDGSSCSDDDACTRTDACQAGTCIGADPVTCAADQCRDAGTCNPTTGTCTNPAKPDGTTCDDTNDCTQGDACQAGTCTGAASADGSPCDDDSACTGSDTCLGGTCVGTSPTVCAAPDQCHDAGTCDPASGGCVYPARPDATPCDDRNGCTDGDTCTAGVCGGTAKADGSGCDDGNGCTRTDTCQGGVCTGANPLVCTALDQCHGTAAACDPATGTCPNPQLPDGSPCDDGKACTRNDTCSGGTCGGTAACAAPDSCHQDGVCDPITGQCVNAPKAEGSACDDGDPCTIDDTCTAGVCGGGTMPDRDQDGVCDLVDVCPDIPNPDQADDDQNGVGNVCECTAPPPGRCIAGGGSKKTDCNLEFNTTQQVTYNKKRTKVKKVLRCIDGDPSCDFDHEVNGACKFGVSICMTNTDPRFPRCSATGPLAFEVRTPRMSKNPMDKMNMWALEEMVRTVGLEIRRNNAVYTPGKAITGLNHCSPLVKLQVPAPTGKAKKVRKTFRVRSTTPAGKRDRDRFVLECRR